MVTVQVKLLGKARELSSAASIGVSVQTATPRDIVNEIARGNPLLTDSLIRANGDPRASTKILINGNPPRSLDEPIDAASDVVVIGVLEHCDG
jgi:hypothetical protein